jgi:hypothetical protein
MRTERSPAELRPHESCRRDSNPHGPEWRSGASPLGHGSRNVGTASALGRDRTDDLRFTKPALHQLSYKGMAGRQGVEPCPPGFGVRAAPGARPVKVKKKCRPLESNQVLLLFRQAREPSTPGRQSLLRALLQGIEPCSRGRRPRRDPIASKSKEVGWRDSNPLEPGSRPGDSPFVISQHQRHIRQTSVGVPGIEPGTLAYQTRVLPLDHTPLVLRVWVAGFEPATSRIRTVRSGQTELHPDKEVGMTGFEPATSRTPSARSRPS